jgi:integron integrase
MSDRFGDQASPQRPTLLGKLREELAVRHYARRTVKSHVLWVRRYLGFHGRRHPREMGAPEIHTFLSHLATDLGVSASTQNQALSALLFLYRHVLGTDVGELTGIARARQRKRVPTVLTPHEVKAVLDRLGGKESLVARLLYGSGLRLLEALRLRVKDLDFEKRQVTVRSGKGDKDRRTMLPHTLVDPLRHHLMEVRRLHQQDLAAGWGRVELPYALARKYPNAASEWGWQWVFPQHRRWHDPSSHQEGRHHLDPTLVQKAVRRAVLAAGISKPASCHTFRHSLPRICWKRCRTSARSRNSSATAM